MANFRTTHPGRTRVAVHQPIAGHPPRRGSIDRLHYDKPQQRFSRLPAPIARPTTEDQTAEICRPTVSTTSALRDANLSDAVQFRLGYSRFSGSSAADQLRFGSLRLGRLLDRSLSFDRLLTNYDNSGVILVLERHIAPEPIKPSFPCYKARSVAERAIRASAALAGYDRSIAAAYQWALKLATGDDLTELRHEQADWLKTRNACGSDAECLAKSMRNRADLLMQQ